MHRHWTRCGPPTYVSAALFLGLTGRGADRRERLDDGDALAAFLAEFPGGGRG